LPVLDKFERIPLGQIQVDRATRQRREIDTKGLAASIRKNGVLNPIIVEYSGLHPESGLPLYNLIAGERRLLASRELGLPDIPVRLYNSLSYIERRIIELEENLKRTDLGWIDMIRATGEIHDLYCSLDSDWTLGETADALSISQSQLSIQMRVYNELDENPKLLEAGTLREAYNLIARVDNRMMGDTLADILEIANAPLEQRQQVIQGQTNQIQPNTAVGTSVAEFGPGSAVVPLRQVGPSVGQTILHESFLRWAPNYSGRKFNFIHCDFPFGVDVFGGQQGGRDASEIQYQDTKQVYFELLDCLCDNLERVMSVSAHLMFWYSIRYHQQTLDIFRAKCPSLKFTIYPLIWHKSDNAGIASRPDQPRHIYETCLLASRGNRALVQIKGDLHSCPTDKKWHPSTKPEPMLKHFMTMFIDEHSTVLDPTCGGGSALRVAEELGASYVLGMDSDEATVGLARTALRQHRATRAASTMASQLL
jgi:ParB/RepB/Spo0J family partition protein